MTFKMRGLYTLVFLYCIKSLLVTGYVYDSDYLVPPKCQPCEARLCPQLTFCAGKEVKDHCGCCPRCSSDLFQPHAVDQQDTIESTTESPSVGQLISANPCEKRQCPKFKVCMINVQGLPLCNCPSSFVCKRGGSSNRGTRDKDERVCGTDGQTYETRCHLRIANCNSKRRIKQKYSGECKVTDAIETTNQEIEGFKLTNGLDSQDTAYLETLSKARRRKIKQKKRKGKKKKQRERRRQRKEKERMKKNKGGGKERKRRRMKRRNQGFNAYSNGYYDPYYPGKYTKWSRSTVRKSRI